MPNCLIMWKVSGGRKKKNKLQFTEGWTIEIWLQCTEGLVFQQGLLINMKTSNFNTAPLSMLLGMVPFVIVLKTSRTWLPLEWKWLLDYAGKYNMGWHLPPSNVFVQEESVESSLKQGCLFLIWKHWACLENNV